MRLHDLLNLQQEFDDTFRQARAWSRSPGAAPELDPQADISRSEGAYAIRVDLPGVKREQVRVYSQEGAISISGNKVAPDLPAGSVLRRERQYGRFSRLVALPSDADFGDVRATLKQGVLHIRVGRARPGEIGQIEIAIE